MDAAFEVLKSGHGLLRDLPGVRVWGVDDGALVLGKDATPDHRVQSVVKATAGTKVLMPWQDAAAACRRVFIPGLDD